MRESVHDRLDRRRYAGADRRGSVIYPHHPETKTQKPGEDIARSFPVGDLRIDTFDTDRRGTAGNGYATQSDGGEQYGAVPIRSYAGRAPWR
jgi:hypothetical protein